MLNLTSRKINPRAFASSQRKEQEQETHGQQDTQEGQSKKKTTLSSISDQLENLEGMRNSINQGKFTVIEGSQPLLDTASDAIDTIKDIEERKEEIVVINTSAGVQSKEEVLSNIEKTKKKLVVSAMNIYESVINMSSNPNTDNRDQYNRTFKKEPQEVSKTKEDFQKSLIDIPRRILSIMEEFESKGRETFIQVFRGTYSFLIKEEQETRVSLSQARFSIDIQECRLETNFVTEMIKQDNLSTGSVSNYQSLSNTISKNSNLEFSRLVDHPNGLLRSVMASSYMLSPFSSYPGAIVLTVNKETLDTLLISSFQKDNFQDFFGELSRTTSVIRNTLWTLFRQYGEEADISFSRGNLFSLFPGGAFLVDSVLSSQLSSSEILYPCLVIKNSSSMRRTKVSQGVVYSIVSNMLLSLTNDVLCGPLEETRVGMAPDWEYQSLVRSSYTDPSTGSKILDSSDYLIQIMETEDRRERNTSPFTFKEFSDLVDTNDLYPHSLAFSRVFGGFSSSFSLTGMDTVDLPHEHQLVYSNFLSTLDHIYGIKQASSFSSVTSSLELEFSSLCYFLGIPLSLSFSLHPSLHAQGVTYESIFHDSGTRIQELQSVVFSSCQGGSFLDLFSTFFNENSDYLSFYVFTVSQLPPVSFGQSVDPSFLDKLAELGVVDVRS